jgi:hypothetical protein
MSCKPGLNRSQGKGDAWRVDHRKFSDAMSKITKLPKDTFRGTVFLKKHGKTIVKY